MEIDFLEVAMEVALEVDLALVEDSGEEEDQVEDSYAIWLQLQSLAVLYVTDRKSSNKLLFVQ